MSNKSFWFPKKIKDEIKKSKINIKKENLKTKDDNIREYSTFAFKTINIFSK